MGISGDTLRAARERLGESQAAFADRFGVNQSTIHRWETEGPPASGTARRLIERVVSDLSGPSDPASRQPEEAA